MFAPWSPQPLRGFNECLVSPPLGRHIFAPRLVATAATQFRCISLSPRCSPQGLREFHIFILRSLMVPAIAYVQCIPVCSAPGRLNHVFFLFFIFLVFTFLVVKDICVLSMHCLHPHPLRTFNRFFVASLGRHSDCVVST